MGAEVIGACVGAGVGAGVGSGVLSISVVVGASVFCVQALTTGASFVRRSARADTTRMIDR